MACNFFANGGTTVDNFSCCSSLNGAAIIFLLTAVSREDHLEGVFILGAPHLLHVVEALRWHFYVVRRLEDFLMASQIGLGILFRIVIDIRVKPINGVTPAQFIIIQAI